MLDDSAFSLLKEQLERIIKDRRSIFRKLCALLVIIINLPLIILIRLLRPFVWIRFGMLNSARIGHFSANTELYLCKRAAGIEDNKTFDIFCHDTPISNYQLKKMWERIRPLHICGLSRYLYIANKLLPGYRKHLVFLSSDRDLYNLYDTIPAHLYFTREEEEQGYKELEDIGIPRGGRFVCIHARDRSYLNSVFPQDDWSYHDFRDSDINKFHLAAAELVKRGYYILRMGVNPEAPFKTDNPRIVDYATKFRTDFLDIFISAKCSFYLGDSCGINGVALIFRRPAALTNYIPLEYALTWGKNNLFISKKLWLAEESRFMTFREIFASGAGRFLSTEQYKKINVQTVDNTAEEIAALAREMDERLKGSWQNTQEYDQLQARFRDLFRLSELNGKVESRMGAEFLYHNRELLD